MNINGKHLAMLGQNALKHKMHNNGDDKLFTIVKNAHIIYALQKGRWLTPSELLLAQAFLSMDLVPMVLHAPFQYQEQDGTALPWSASAETP